MTDFKSELKNIKAGDKQIFNFLCDFNNFEKLMPEQVIHWQSTKDSCSFTIKGMADLAMKIDKKEEFRLVSYVSEGKSPFSFQLNFFISKQDEGASTVSSVLQAKLNPMIKMMASRPLQNFVNLLVDKLKELMEDKI